MPVTFSPAPELRIETSQHKLLAHSQPFNEDRVTDALLAIRAHHLDAPVELLQSSFHPSVFPGESANSTDGSVPPAFVPYKNGLVHTILEAYAHHHALAIRPDDVWICVLTQLALFVNGPDSAEVLRKRFVHHEGQKELRVYAPMGSRHTVDYGSLTTHMTTLIQKNIRDTNSCAWITPSFTTTTPNDIVVANVVLMATLKSYFTYCFDIMCGIPRVTLRGERKDWEDLLRRVDQLDQFGPETRTWSRMLRPVMTRFVRAFDEGYAKSEDNREFWSQAIHRSGWPCGPLPDTLTGWITAFTVFDRDGKWIGGNLYHDPNGSETLIFKSPSPGLAKTRSTLVIDDVCYGTVHVSLIPPAHVDVDVKIVDAGKEYDAVMVAGLIGASISDCEPDGSGNRGDQLNPVSGWWIFTIKKGVSVMDARAQAFAAEMAARNSWWRWFCRLIALQF